MLRDRPQTRDLTAVDYAGEGRITDCGAYVRVDFGNCNSWELTALYRGFASFCVDSKVTRALLRAGDNDPKGHYRLRDALTTMALLSQIAPEFKLALIPSTQAIEVTGRCSTSWAPRDSMPGCSRPSWKRWTGWRDERWAGGRRPSERALASLKAAARCRR